MGTDRQVQCIATPEPKQLLVSETRRQTELLWRDGQDDKALCRQACERGKSRGTAQYIDLSVAKFNRQCG